MKFHKKKIGNKQGGEFNLIKMNKANLARKSIMPVLNINSTTSFAPLCVKKF